MYKWIMVFYRQHNLIIFKYFKFYLLALFFLFLDITLSLI